MYTLTQRQIDWMFSAPPCRGLYKAGDGYCAIGKFVGAILGERIWDGYYMDYDFGQPTIPFLAKKLLSQMMNHMFSEDFPISRISNTNDMGPNLHEQHYKALKMIMERAVETKFIKVEDSLAAEFSERIKQLTSG